MKVDRDFKLSLSLRSELLFKQLFSSSSAPWQQRVLREILLSLPLKKRAACLDAACGVGNNIRSLLDSCTHVYAFDRSERALEFAIKRYVSQKDVHFSIGQLEHVPFEDELFDLVVCTEALEHVRDTTKAVVELCRVLKKEGYLILSFQNYLNPSALIKPIFEMITKKNWDAWGTHDHDEGFERHLTYFNVRNALKNIPNIKIEMVKGADYLNGWFNWVPGIRKNYDLLDRFPLLFLGKIPFLKILGMDCFIVVKKL